MSTDVRVAADLIDRLGLQPHPEGGHYRELYRHRAAGGRRGDLTSICYLLQSGEVSRWHRVTDAVEIWHHHAGAALELMLSPDGRGQQTHRLGGNVMAGDEAQIVVPAGCWQSARSLGSWTLAGCAVAPAFEFGSFELAPPGWHPHI